MTGAGPKPKLAWIEVDAVDVDMRYQRTIEGKRSRALIERIGKDFKWAACQAVMVAPAEKKGRFAVLDGQHRVEGAKRAGVKSIPAVIVAAGSVSDYAQAFVRANLDRVAMNSISLYHARLAAEDPAATAIDRLCRSAGLSIPRYQVPTASLKPGETIAVGSIGMLRKRHGERTAKLTLKCVADAYATTPGAVRASLLRAAGAIVGRDEKAAAATAERLTAALKRTKPSALEDTARRRWRHDGGTEIAALIAELERLIDPPRPVAVLVRPGENWARKLAAPAKAPAIAPGPAPKSKTANDDAAIAAHIAAKGVTHIEICDVDAVMNETRRLGYRVVADTAFLRFELDDGARTVNRAGLLTLANTARAKRHLKPWSLADVEWKRPVAEDVPWRRWHGLSRVERIRRNAARPPR